MGLGAVVLQNNEKGSNVTLFPLHMSYRSLDKHDAVAPNLCFYTILNTLHTVINYKLNIAHISANVVHILVCLQTKTQKFLADDKSLKCKEEGDQHM